MITSRRRFLGVLVLSLVAITALSYGVFVIVGAQRAAAHAARARLQLMDELSGAEAAVALCEVDTVLAALRKVASAMDADESGGPQAATQARIDRIHSRCAACAFGDTQRSIAAVARQSESMAHMSEQEAASATQAATAVLSEAKVRCASLKLSATRFGIGDELVAAWASEIEQLAAHVNRMNESTLRSRDARAAREVEAQRAVTAAAERRRNPELALRNAVDRAVSEMINEAAHWDGRLSYADAVDHHMDRVLGPLIAPNNRWFPEREQFRLVSERISRPDLADYSRQALLVIPGTAIVPESTGVGGSQVWTGSIQVTMYWSDSRSHWVAAVPSVETVRLKPDVSPFQSSPIEFEKITVWSPSLTRYLHDVLGEADAIVVGE